LRPTTQHMLLQQSNPMVADEIRLHLPQTLQNAVLEGTSTSALEICQQAAQGDLDGLKRRQEQGEDLDVGDYDGRTALHLAAAYGNLPIVQFLVEEAGCTLRRDRFGGLPIHDALRGGHEEVKDYLQGIDFEVQCKSWQEGVKCDKGHLMDKVLTLILKQGVWAFADLYSEVEYFFNELGLDGWYFEHYPPSQIARHVHCYIASKKVGQTTGAYTIQFHMESEHTAFYLCTVGENQEPFHQTEQLITDWVNAVSDANAYSLHYVVSTAPAFKGKKDKLAIYICETSPFQQHEVSEEVDNIELVATEAFLREKHPICQRRYQQLLQNMTQSTSSSWAGVMPLTAKDARNTSRGWEKWLIQFAIRQKKPTYLQQFSQVLQHFGVQAREKHVETFQNGVTCYHFYFENLPQQQLADCLRALQLVPHMKQSPLTHLFLENAISSDALIYFGCAAKFAFHFVEKDTPEYLDLASALAADPSKKEALDRLYLQAIQDLMTEERVLEVVQRHLGFCQRLYSDFKQIALGERQRFLNEDLAKQLEMIRDETDAKVLRAMLTFNSHIRATNFFREGGTPRSLAFCLDASFLPTVSSAVFPEAPHTVYLVVGRTFYGFHVRFRDVARGGIRVIKSASRATHRRNAATLFEENYNLAFTQQRKNKDIPEGGSKGTILLDADAQGTVKESFMSYVDALLDCMLPEKVGIHCPRPDILFLGPDENTADLMALGALHARKRGYPLWKSLTTGKPPSLGGIPHDTYGMTTLSVHTFKLELLKALGKREEDMTKIQTGGPDGDLGCNEIKISKDRTLGIVDGSGVAYDPEGLDRAELMDLADRRVMIENFNCAKLSPGGFVVKVSDVNVTLPDGTLVPRGDVFRDTFHLSKYAVADLFVPCGGRPKAVTADNVQQLLVNGHPKFQAVIEGANLFLTDPARRVLEDAGVHVLKDASTNKGGVTSSSLEVLAALVMPVEDHDRLMSIPDGAPAPEFYKQYVQHIQSVIAEKASMEFKCMWNVKCGGTGVHNTDTTEQLSQKINGLCDTIATEIVDSADKDLICTVLRKCMPPLLVEHYGVEHIMEHLPNNYMHASIAAWLSATYVYECGYSATEFAFHKFLRGLQESPKQEGPKGDAE